MAEQVLANLTLTGARLGILTMGADAVRDSFVRRKMRTAASVGVVVKRVDVPQSGTTADVVVAAQSLQEDVDGIVVQLPLSTIVDTSAVLAVIDPHKDVDALTRQPLVHAPVAEAVVHILKENSVPVAGAEVAVVGAGRLVGAPTASILRALGARVSVMDKGDSLGVLKGADIVVSGAGRPHLIRPAHIKDGVVLIDAGTSESAGKVVGDIDPACVAKAKLATPVPGGVGPLAVAMLFKNLEELVRMQRNSQI